MSLSPGTRLGHYDVTALIGEGGMGQVWQATDTQLNRQVALKILPDAFADDPDRLARFQREAQVLASLNHPNIAAIHGIEKSDDTQALVLELVEGPTLDDRIAKEPIPVDEALPIAKQIAEALEAAHEAGVIHRDLKPANIKVREDGTVKVLDFGLAKALAGEASSPDLSQSPTMTGTVGGTREGVILGTAAYMSPEQARGKPLDKRTDIWSFGCVLFEMLTGKAAFAGETLSDTIANVLDREPRWETLPSKTPPTVRGLLHRCLDQDPRDRLRDIGDARVGLGARGTDSGRFAAEFDAVEASRNDVRFKSPLAWIAIAALAGTTGFVGWMMKPVPSTQRFEFSVAPADDAPLGQPIQWSGPEVAVVFSPDGREIVYVVELRDTSQLFRRGLDEAVATPIVGTEGGVQPVFSPDGEWIAFRHRSEGTLNKVRSIGGVAVELSDEGQGLDDVGASWGRDGVMVLGGRDGLTILRDSPGAVPELLIASDPALGEIYYSWPHFLPDGETLLFTIVRAGRAIDDSQVAAVNIRTKERKIVHDEGFNPRYSPTGHLLYGLRDAVRAVPFDLGQLEVTGDSPTVVLEGVTTNDLGSAKFDVSNDGVLVYVPGEEPRAQVLVDRSGAIVPLHRATGRAGTSVAGNPRFSPDGMRWSGESLTDGDWEIWSHDLERGNQTRVTRSPGGDFWSLWTPTGDSLVFASNRDGVGGVFRKAADGTGSAELLIAPNGHARHPFTWSADGTTLVFQEEHPDRGLDLWLLPLSPSAGADSSDRVPRPLLQAPGDQSDPVVSPDGRWFAYESDESGQAEVYVDRFPDLGDRRPISVGGGSEPLWASDGDELFYRQGDAVIAVRIFETEPGFRHDAPVPLFSGAFAQNTIPRHWDVHPDGDRFVMIERSTLAELRVVTGWFEVLERLVPTN